MFGGQNAGFLDDTWELGSADWLPVGLVDGAPPPRSGHTLVYDRFRRQAVLLSGLNAPRTDTWVFRYLSAWPDEVCDSGGDDDLDGLTDCADPDCVGLAGCP